MVGFTFASRSYYFLRSPLRRSPAPRSCPTTVRQANVRGTGGLKSVQHGVQSHILYSLILLNFFCALKLVAWCPIMRSRTASHAAHAPALTHKVKRRIHRRVVVSLQKG